MHTCHVHWKPMSEEMLTVLNRKPLTPNIEWYSNLTFTPERAERP